MTIDSASNAFFNNNDWAINVTWTVAATSDKFIVNGIFDKQYYSAPDDFGVAVSSNSPTFTMKTSDIPTGAKVNDSLLIPVNNVDVTYKVKVIERDGTGVSLLELQKQ
jgi:hypothetical protein